MYLLSKHLENIHLEHPIILSNYKYRQSQFWILITFRDILALHLYTPKIMNIWVSSSPPSQYKLIKSISFFQAYVLSLFLHEQATTKPESTWNLKVCMNFLNCALHIDNFCIFSSFTTVAPNTSDFYFFLMHMFCENFLGTINCNTNV